MSDERADGLAISLLWLALVVGMVLHFTYDVSALRYGIDITIPGSTGTVPWSNFTIKALFYVLPFLLAVIAAGGAGKPYRAVNFGLAILFVLANASHIVVNAMRSSDVIGHAQTLLLTAVLVANAQLIRLSHRWWRPKPSTT